MDNLPRVGVLGGGQLGRMLLEEANRLNIPINILDTADAPAKQISAHQGHVEGSFSDPKAVAKLAEKCDLLTIEIEHVDTEILEEVAKKGVKVEPSWQTIRTIQDKFAQKLHLQAHGVPTAEGKEVETVKDLETMAQDWDLPLMLKARRQAYDGRGNYVVHSVSDFAPALAALGTAGKYIEKWAPFRMELAVMVLKTKDDILAYPTVETVHEDSICKLVYAPARGISPAIAQKAQQLARNAVSCFPGKGVFGVEMFLLPDDTLLVNEIAPRPHNSGHYTIEACALSQYAAHLRAILDLPIPPTSLALAQPAVMLNILGGANPSDHMRLATEALTIPSARLHLYGKPAARPGRKMGHVTITAPSVLAAEVAITPLLATFNALRAKRSDLPPPYPPRPSPAVAPVVGIVTGSISDQRHLDPAYELLHTLDIEYKTEVCSAHRMPDEMIDYAAAAASRGIRVIIAAAGGAAHLPGMVAAKAGTVPVIGLPIQPSVGDGWNSLVSMTDMPRGVPVLTVGVNNAVNAALGAARIVACWDEGVKERLAKWVKEQNEEAKHSNRKVREQEQERRARWGREAAGM